MKGVIKGLICGVFVILGSFGFGKLVDMWSYFCIENGYSELFYMSPMLILVLIGFCLVGYIFNEV